MSLEDAFLKVLGIRERRPSNTLMWVPKGFPHFEAAILSGKFHHAALDGRLPIWANRGPSISEMLEGRAPIGAKISDVWEAVPKEFWLDHSISTIGLTAFQVLDHEGESPGWYNFMTSSAAVDALWPTKRR
jgi:hypothetical protein